MGEEGMGLPEEEEMIGEQNLRQLRSSATQLLLAENWSQYISLYTQFISQCSSCTTTPKLEKHIISALSNRAEAFHRIGHHEDALKDCNRVLEIDPNHRKALLCKGKVLLDLDCYSAASVCFQKGLDSQLAERCRRLDKQARSGSLDISDWVLSGFQGEPPEIAEYVGPVEIGRSKNGRGLFATKNIEAGTPLFVTKAVVIGRGIVVEDEGRLVMWKEFVNEAFKAARRCRRTLELIYCLSTGEEENSEIPDMGLFKPEQWWSKSNNKKEPDTKRILKILELNCLSGDSISAGVLGRSNASYLTGDYCTVGLWILPSLANHSCHPNARRLHIGDFVVVHAARDVKAGEELTLAYFDVLQPLQDRREMANGWGFKCHCERCEFEEKLYSPAVAVPVKSPVEVEEMMGRKENSWALKRKEKGFLRASFWKEYAAVYGSERLMRRSGRRLPAAVATAESVAAAVGGDERMLKVAVDGLKRAGDGKSGRGGSEDSTEKVMKIGRGVYGKVVRRKEAMGALLEELKLQ